MTPNQKARNLGMVRLRALRRYKLARTPKPKLRKRQRPHQSRTRLAKAIEESRGNWGVLAELLKCSVGTVRRVLEREENELLLQAFEDERLAQLYRTEQNVFDLAQYCPNPAVRLRASEFILQHRHSDYHPSSRITVEGGNKPIQVQSAVVQIPAEILSLPVDAQLKLLEQADAREKELNGDDGKD